MKIIIFYASIGSGHVSAARTVEKSIREKNPTTLVVLKDIRAFMNPVWRALDERLYWFIAENLPESFDLLYTSFSRKGAHAPSIASLANDYPAERVVEYIRSEAPDVILSTHYGAAQVLGGLRERGFLRRTPIGWIHTDYIQSYFPRISNRIDRTFVALPDLASKWTEAGVPSDKVVATGMPVDIPRAEKQLLRRELETIGLSTDIMTILIVMGGSGVGDQVGMVRNLVAKVSRPVQIVAVCGANAVQQSHLETYSLELPAQVSLVPLGFVPHDMLVNLIGAVDLLITKPGGLTPSEAFALRTPTIVLDVIPGHERENAETFARLGLAKISRGVEFLGEDVAALMNDRDALSRMRHEQTQYSQNLSLDPIVDFALAKSATTDPATADFGREYGVPASGVESALKRIDRDAPVDVELLLSYATARRPQRIVLENPFGHIAIRVGDVVYSANHIARREADPKFLQHIRIEEYLYGTTPPSSRRMHTSTYGMAYGRETIAMRVSGVHPRRLSAMRDEIDAIEAEYSQGELIWDRRSLNCADLVARILAAGGWPVNAESRSASIPSMPLDVFEAAEEAFASEADLRVSLVAYRQILGANADYRYSRFPASLCQPVRSLSNVLRDSRADSLEVRVARQVATTQGNRRLFADILEIGASEQGRTDIAVHSIERAMLTDLWKLFNARFREAICGARDLRFRLSGELNGMVEEVSGAVERATSMTEQVGSSGIESLRRLCDAALLYEIRGGDESHGSADNDNFSLDLRKDSDLPRLDQSLAGFRGPVLRRGLRRQAARWRQAARKLQQLS
jgi:UDP-N-acetylglucosamine:LPS N-acetylglucosamine transferase